LVPVKSTYNQFTDDEDPVTIPTLSFNRLSKIVNVPVAVNFLVIEL